MLLKKRVDARTLEVILLIIMALFGIAIIWIYLSAINLNEPKVDSSIVIIELQLFMMVILTGSIYIKVKIWEKNRAILELIEDRLETKKSKPKRGKKK